LPLDDEAALDARHIDLLRWRARRGLLECDLFVQRFFATHAASLRGRHAKGFLALMHLDDPELLDLLLARTEPTASTEVAQPHAREVLTMMRCNQKAAGPSK
jgi:antitoxin CptB